MSHGSDTFHCVVDGVSACSRAPQPQIFVDSRLWQSIIGLCERTSTEWLAYLIGEKDAEGNYEIKKLTFPEQTAGGAHVHHPTNPEFRPEKGTIGAIHSHVRMQAFFSTTDVAHANWPVEMVVNARGEYEVSVRVTLPCGESMRRKATVMLLTGGVLDNMETALKAALDKGKKREEREHPSVVSETHGGYGFGGSRVTAPYWYSSRHNEEPMLLGGKYLICPIDGKKALGAGCCQHNLKEMEAYEESQEGIAP
jgi:hypothetical protein